MSMKHGGLQWPCSTEEDPGTSVLHVTEFTHGKTTALRRIEFVPPPEITSKEYPFVLTSGRNLYQYNAATQTGRTPNAGMYSRDCLSVSLSDAQRLGLADGESVRLRSHTGEAVISVKINDSVRRGNCMRRFIRCACF